MKIGEIEKEIPIERGSKGDLIGLTEKLDVMEVGDSRLFIVEDLENIRVGQGRISSSIGAFHRKKIKRFISRTERNTIRVWRVK